MNSYNEEFVKISFQVSLTETKKQRLLLTEVKRFQNEKVDVL